MLYLIYAESANYAGYGQHFVVEAEAEEEAKELAEAEIEDYFYQQDQDQLEEEDVEVHTYGSIVRVEEFGPGHDEWQYYLDPGQAQFYTKV
jgi:hypothetical protein